MQGPILIKSTFLCRSPKGFSCPKKAPLTKTFPFGANDPKKHKNDISTCKGAGCAPTYEVSLNSTQNIPRICCGRNIFQVWLRLQWSAPIFDWILQCLTYFVCTASCTRSKPWDGDHIKDDGKSVFDQKCLLWCESQNRTWCNSFTTSAEEVKSCFMCGHYHVFTI